MVSCRRGEGVGANTRYGGSATRKAARGPGSPTILHMFLSFSVVPNVIRQWLVLTVLAVSVHLEYDARCSVSLLQVRPPWEARRNL